MAEAALQRSLELEPDSSIARNELGYIADLRSQSEARKKEIPWFLHSFVKPPTDSLTVRLLALVEDMPSIPGPKTVGAENYSAGSSADQPCNGTAAGRGCLNLTGGIIQKQRGAVGLTSGQGYIKRYTYNACAASDPPPYFPTTGRFARNRVYELDPRNFDVATWFAANQNN